MATIHNSGSPELLLPKDERYTPIYSDSAPEEPEALSSNPRLPSCTGMDASEAQETRRKLVNFFRTGNGGGLTPTLSPALLAPYQDMSRIRFDYPLWIASAEQQTEYRTIPLSEMLQKAIDTCAPQENDARALKDNLGALEEIIRKRLSRDFQPVDAEAELNYAFDKLTDNLGLSGNEGKVLIEDIKRLKAELPEGGNLLPFSAQSALHIFNAGLRYFLKSRKTELVTEIRSCINRLQEMIQIEKSKDKSARSADGLKDTMGDGGLFMDMNKLSSLLPKSPATMQLPEARRNRIERIIESLFSYEDLLTSGDALILLPATLKKETRYQWGSVFSGFNIVALDDEDTCKVAMTEFDKHMQSMACLFGAIRIARLELDNRYNEEYHDEFFNHFDWKSFTPEEMSLCPPVILFEEEQHILEHSYLSFSSLLLSARPVNIVVLSDGILSKPRISCSDEQFKGFPQELGHLSSSHGQAFVLQSSPAQPAHLMNGYLQGLKCSLPSFFYILSPSQKKTGNTDLFIWNSAAIESRDFPHFTFNPESSSLWGQRMDISANPAAKASWPRYKFSVGTADHNGGILSIAFTFADFVSQDPRYKDLFMPIPDNFEWDGLYPAADVLEHATSGQQFQGIPYIWMTDESNHLHRVAVSYSVMMSCLERANYWSRLQDLGGTRSYHAMQASTHEREIAEQSKQEAIEEIRREFEEKMRTLREEAASEAMERLASILLDMDSLELSKPSSSAPASAPAQAAAPAAQEEAKVAEPEPEEEDDLGMDEPWIESFRCTSCNECININGNMFKYNADKQAYVADADAGTYEQLVQAAEKCSAHCIHPGKPRNADEPNLDELKKRAEPYL